MSDLVIIPASADSDPYVELGTRGAVGSVFRKHLLNLGPLHYGGKTYNLDEKFYSQLKSNFDAGVSIVQVPVADEKNRHTEDPLRNAGECVGLEREGDKVYSVLDIRDPKVAEGIRNKTILGVSAMLSMDYKDSRNDKPIGAALLHTCITNRPHVLDLEPYQEVVAATADSTDMDFDSPIVLATEETVPTKEDLIAALKADHGIDVEALQVAATQKVDLTAITDALAGTSVQLSSGDALEQSDVVGAIVELARKNETLEGAVGLLTRKDAERTVQGFIDSGRLLAKSRGRAVSMFLSEGQAGLDDFLSPEDEPFIRMTEQSGITGEGDGEQKHNFDIDSEITRLGAVASSIGGAPGSKLK